ncbi:hypothetical protein TKK_0006937 [Trichogramma kaykai]
MGEPKPEVAFSNGAVKQKPTTLNLSSGTSFYRSNLVNGRGSLNDHRHLQSLSKGPSLENDYQQISRLKSAISTASRSNESQLQAVLPLLTGLQQSAKQQSLSSSSWSSNSSDHEDPRDSPPPPTPASANPPNSISHVVEQRQLNGNHHGHQPIGGIGQSTRKSANGINSSNNNSNNNHVNVNGFSLYTPPTPIPAVSTASSKVQRTIPNGLPQPAPRRSHNIVAPPYHLTAIQQITAAFASSRGSPSSSSSSSSAASAAATAAVSSTGSSVASANSINNAYDTSPLYTLSSTAGAAAATPTATASTATKTKASSSTCSIPGSASWSGLNGLCSSSNFPETNVSPAIQKHKRYIDVHPESKPQQQQQLLDAIPSLAGPVRIRSSATSPATASQSLRNGDHCVPRRSRASANPTAAASISTIGGPSGSSFATAAIINSATSPSCSPSASSSTTCSSTTSSVCSVASNGTQSQQLYGNAAATATTPAAAWSTGEHASWDSSSSSSTSAAAGLVPHQPVARKAYSTTLPLHRPQSPTPTSKDYTLIATSNSNTWNCGASLKTRPHSIASSPQCNGVSSLAISSSPSDSGYRSLPSASSDYQLKSTSLQQAQAAQMRENHITRRQSLPSAQSLMRTNGPRPSPTFHGLPFKPFNCGVSPNGNPLFLGCTHLHGSSSGNVSSTGSSTRISTPASTPTSLLSTAQVIQQLLNAHKNGFKIDEDKLKLFIEILDTQERFAKVSLLGKISRYRDRTRYELTN